VFPASPRVAQLAVLDPNEPNTAEGTYVMFGSLERNRSWLFVTKGSIAASR
jgi:hypothetical protein